MTWLPAFRFSSFSLGLVAVVLVIATVCIDVQNMSPGKLAAAHAQHPELAGTQNCQACHGAPGQTMTQACLVCHQEIDLQFMFQRGLHGNLSSELAAECAACHAEHHGKEFVATNGRSFELAGVKDTHHFSHEGLDFHLQGKHLSIGCEKCHPNANVEFLSVGEKRFLGLEQSCISCHQDVHQGVYGADCASCHGQQHPFSRVAQFVHTKDFKLEGSHSKAGCVDCHPSDSPHAITTLLATNASADSVAMGIRSCQACHESPHQDHFLASVATELQLTADQSCQHCHPTGHGTFVGSTVMRDSGLHDHTGFALADPHEKLKCEACHVGFGQPKTQLVSFHQTFPGRHPDDCQACHRDPHQGQFDAGLYRGADCLTCHQRHEFEPSAFTMDQHAQTRFPLRGEHARVGCKDCHKLSTGQGLIAPLNFVSRWDLRADSPKVEPTLVRVFHGTSLACKDCHQDPHDGQFERGAFRGSDCSACHDESSFRRPTFSLEQHAMTSFELTGAHAAVACRSCHTLPGEMRQAAAEFGQMVSSRVFQGTPTQCNACHVDVHDGQFDQPHLPAIVDGNVGCARCHTTESFQRVRAGEFDHNLWTGYDLRGAHARARCTDCHARTPSVDRLPRTFARAAGRDCQSCHRDPHVGQFGPTNQVNCTQCHVDGDSFGQLVFDHQQHSRFQLDRGHAKFACASCHRPQQLTDGRTAVRYKPLGIQCGDCHVASGPRSTRSRGGP